MALDRLESPNRVIRIGNTDRITITPEYVNDICIARVVELFSKEVIRQVTNKKKRRDLGNGVNVNC
jgi:hypothetical protein